MTRAYVDDGLYTAITRLAQHTPAALDALIRLWSDYGLALFALLIALAWVRAHRTGRPLLPVMAVPVVVVIAYAVNTMIKDLVGEARPCQVLPVTPLESCPPPGDWAYPSNHTAIAAAAAIALLLLDRRLGWIAVPAAILMATSRVWIGVHYPHDVLAGLLTGGALGAALTWLARRITTHTGHDRTPVRTSLE